MTEISLKDRLLHDPAVSYWLKDAIITALKRDPVDALRDAELLVQVLKNAWKEVGR